MSSTAMAGETTDPGAFTLQVEGELNAIPNVTVNVKIEGLEEGEILEAEPDVVATLAADPTTPRLLLKDSSQQTDPCALNSKQPLIFYSELYLYAIRSVDSRCT
jgi:hypothetical protein